MRLWTCCSREPSSGFGLARRKFHCNNRPSIIHVHHFSVWSLAAAGLCPKLPFSYCVQFCMTFIDHPSQIPERYDCPLFTGAASTL